MFPVIETKRLKLRALTLEDDAFILKLRSHPNIVKYVEMKPYQDIERARRFIKAVTKDIEDGIALFWGIHHSESNALVGTICLWNFEPVETETGNMSIKAELGYEIHPDHQGMGIAKEAVGAVLEYAKLESPIVTVDAITHKDNVPSLRLLESHVFKCLGIAVLVDPSLEEGPDMCLYRIDLKR